MKFNKCFHNFFSKITDKSMKISPNYTSNDWKRLSNLPVNASTTDWTKAIAILKDRIEGRFLSLIEAIENETFSGFAIIALDCLLIETLNQFWFGIEDTNVNYNGKNGESFKDFFNRSPYFKYHFTDDISKAFYNQIRCGLLHQAETKGNTLINFKKFKMITLIDPSDAKKGIELNRKLFHTALKDEFRNYLELLNDPNNEVIRKNFIKKMNLICR